MNIFTIGGSGMVGTRIIDILRNKDLIRNDYSVTDLSLTNGVDITDPSSLDIIRNDKEHEIVLHLAAKADVEGCEKDKELGEQGPAYRINVTGTKNVAEACRVANKKLLYISTDYVFDGAIEPGQKYKEEDAPNPLSWYAMTKYKGEEVVRNSGVRYAILRIAYPYRSDAFELKNDFVHSILKRLASNLPFAAVTDQYITPTYIDDIAFAVDAIITNNATGIYHVVGSQSLTPYEAFQLMAHRFRYDSDLIGTTTREEFYKGKAPRSFNLSLNNDKITQLGVTMRTFEEGLRKVTNS
jgi:dTDP-4-dehydrorhamnose reductase